MEVPPYNIGWRCTDQDVLGASSHEKLGDVGECTSMERIFPRALVACIAEGRPPKLSELQEVATNVLQQAFAGWSVDNARRLAEVVADAALNGRPTARCEVALLHA